MKRNQNNKVSIKNLFLLNLLLLEHSVIMVEDFEFVVTSQVLLVTSLVVWFVAKRKISVGIIFFFLFAVSVAWKWILMVIKEGGGVGEFGSNGKEATVNRVLDGSMYPF